MYIFILLLLCVGGYGLQSSEDVLAGSLLFKQKKVVERLENVWLLVHEMNLADAEAYGKTLKSSLVSLNGKASSLAESDNTISLWFKSNKDSIDEITTALTKVQGLVTELDNMLSSNRKKRALQPFMGYILSEITGVPDEADFKMIEHKKSKIGNLSVLVFNT